MHFAKARKLTSPAISDMVTTPRQSIRTRSQARDQAQEGEEEAPPATPPRPASASRPSSTRVSTSSSLPPKSPAFRSPTKGAFSPLVAFALDDQSVDSASVSVSSSVARKRLAFHIQKQLAQDIEAAGGIKLFKNKDGHRLSHLCDNREELYGPRGDDLRQKITKKVYRWQLLDKDGVYIEKVLNKLQVKSFSTLQAENREKERAVSGTSRKQRKALPKANLSLSSSSSGDESDSGASSSGCDIVPCTTVSIKEDKKPKPLLVPSHPAPPVTSDIIMSAGFARSPRSPSMPLPRDTGECYRFVLFVL